MSLNHIRPWKNIYRRESRQISVGPVKVGGDAPISVQTMTNTVTSDAAACVAQAMHRDPEQRFLSPTAFATALALGLARSASFADVLRALVRGFEIGGRRKRSATTSWRARASIACSSPSTGSGG